MFDKEAFDVALKSSKEEGYENGYRDGYQAAIEKVKSLLLKNVLGGVDIEE